MNSHEKLVLAVNIALVILLLIDIIFSIYKLGRRKGESIVPNIELHVGIKEVEFQDIKVSANSAGVIKEMTDSLEAITLDKSKKVLMEVSNGSTGGFIVKTKFGSS